MTTLKCVVSNYAFPMRLKKPFRTEGPRGEESGETGGLVLRDGRPYDPAWDVWRPQRRWPGVLLVALVLAAFSAFVAYRFTATPTTTTPPVVPSATNAIQSSYFPPVLPHTAELQNYTGKTSASGQSISATGGLMIWYFQCQCFSNFGVLVHNTSGQLVDVAYNGQGRVTVAQAARYAKGKYTFDVIADGPWSVSLIDPSHLAPLPAPYSYTSHDSSVLGPFTGPKATITAGYIGTVGTNFLTHISDGTNRDPKLMDWMITQGYKKRTVTDLPAKYWIIVDGPGIWNVKVEP